MAKDKVAGTFSTAGAGPEVAPQPEDPPLRSGPESFLEPKIRAIADCFRNAFGSFEECFRLAGDLGCLGGASLFPLRDTFFSYVAQACTNYRKFAEELG
jgi:hypothetical protein